ncbi:SPOSA6832_02993, partial [Sporobolomyces salmonicolor]
TLGHTADLFRRQLQLLLLSFLLFLLAFPSSPVCAGTAHTFTLHNNCNYVLWPAVTNYGANSGDSGPRGWEAAAGNRTTINIPSPWNGRICPGCPFDSSGSGSCVTGNCDGGLECDDQTIGYVNVGEFSLDSWGGNDCEWASIEIEPNGCESVVCATDLNADCPDDRMKQTDSDGTVIGCLSACMAGINATTPSMNCCSGDLNNLTTAASTSDDQGSRLLIR